MASTKEIKRKVGSVKNTQKITRAMKMVASAKLRRANYAVLKMRPYADAVEEIAGKLVSTCSFSDHPLLLLRDEKKAEIIVITSDKGLCGASNHNVLAAAEKMMIRKRKKGIDCKATIVGRVGIGYSNFHEWSVENRYSGILEKQIDFNDAATVSDAIINRYISGETDTVYLIFNKFISVLSQKVQEVRIVPIAELSKKNDNTQYIFEPEKEDLLNKLLPLVIYSQIYRSFLEASASEQAARMIAMDGATNNASEMIQKLTLDFNKARQAQITRELIEISSAIEAMR